MQPPKHAFKTRSTTDWSRERIELLSRNDIEQLRCNAERLGAQAVIALCEEALKAKPRSAAKHAASSRARSSSQRLISRSKAFQARGVYLHDALSWSGVRKSDGAVVMALWARSVLSSTGVCSHLLWAPNVDGSRPWSDSRQGQERLEHCRLALERGGAEGLLVHGESLDGCLPEDKARSVYGVDPEVLVQFRVEQRGEEYWAVWGEKAAARMP